MTGGGTTIATVRSAADLGAVAALFQAYAGSLAVDLAYQNFASELAALPGCYGPPGGELLLARGRDGAAAGCVGLRPMGEAGVAEMKRLYVRPEGRGLGLGGALVAGIVAAAERLGYREVRLDTLPDMAAAMALYERLGFVRIPPYYQTPVAGTVFFARRLGLAPGQPRKAPGQSAA